MLSNDQIKKFQNKIWKFYKNNRRDLPWRETRDPYRIWISEMMLQQTQINRVIDYYLKWIRTFPTVEKLAKASFQKVLQQWQGLGYNRRALFIHKTANIIAQEYKGKFPQEYDSLIALPGIGTYTASAVLTFAFNQPLIFIETNIRSVFIKEFFNKKDEVKDSEIIALIEQTLDKSNPREWYYALMDYGAFIKKKYGNPNVKSRHYSKQKPFRGSDREVRGAIIKHLTNNSQLTTDNLRKLPFEKEKLMLNIKNLEDEGFIFKDEKGNYLVNS